MYVPGCHSQFAGASSVGSCKVVAACAPLVGTGLGTVGAVLVVAAPATLGVAGLGTSCLGLGAFVSGIGCAL